MTIKKNTPTWTDVKAKLLTLDQIAMVKLVQDLYAANKDNQVFLHSRFGLGEDPLKPYQVTISRWLAPDIYRNQTYSVAKAKKAISDYRKAVGHPEGLTELMVHYCEEGFAFTQDVGLDDEGFLDSLVRMFVQALKGALALPEDKREVFLDRLSDVRVRSRDIGWGVGDDLQALWSRAGLDG